MVCDMRRPGFVSRLLCCLALASVACDSSKESKDGAAQEGGEAGKGAKASKGGDAVAAKGGGDGGGAPATGAGGKVFDKDDRKQRCHKLTPELLAKLYDFPVERLEDQRPKDDKLRCNYQWTEGDELFFAQVGSMFVQKDEEASKQHYARSTTNQTQDEVEKQMADVAEKAGERPEMDSKAKKDAAKTATSAFAKMTEEGVTYEPIPGIGDEAKVNSRDGSVWVRIGNAHLIFTAYRGPNKKPLLADGRPVADIDKIMAHEREWVQSTFDERKEAATKLAKAYVPLLLELAE